MATPKMFFITWRWVTSSTHWMIFTYSVHIMCLFQELTVLWRSLSRNTKVIVLERNTAIPRTTIVYSVHLWLCGTLLRPTHHQSHCLWVGERWTYYLELGQWKCSNGGSTDNQLTTSATAAAGLHRASLGGGQQLWNLFVFESSSDSATISFIMNLFCFAHHLLRQGSTQYKAHHQP